MTERVLPAIAIPARGRPTADRLPHPEAVTAPPTASAAAGLRAGAAAGLRAGATTAAPARPVAHAAAQRKEALLTTPARAGMLLGASAAIYAVSLAGIAGLQSQSDAQLAALERPALETLAQARAANARLEAAIARTNANLETLASTYDATGKSLTAYETRLYALASLVADVRGSAASLPAQISLPAVSLHGTVGTAASGAAPATTATTTASGKVIP